jgi:hypothetical protein
VGLAPQNDPNNKLSSFIEQVSGGDKLRPVFSFYLPENQNGKLMLGGYDLSKFAAAGSSEKDIVWSQVAVDEKTWSATLNSVQLGGKHIASKSEKIMLDTGLSYNLVPKDDVESVAKALMGYGIECKPPSFTGKLELYKCKCFSDNLKSLQPIQLFIGGQFFDLPVQSYIQ